MRYPRNRKMTIIISFALITALVLASCKGGGTGDSGTLTGVALSGLVVADHVSVVEPKPGGSPKPQPAPQGIAGLLLGLVSPGQLPATSDYFTDKTSVYVNERSTESFNTINMILCMVRQTRYDAMTNRGPYLALVDEGLCSTERSNASTAGQQTTNTSSGSTATIYSSWITDSYRGSDTSPQIVRYWITITERGGGTISLIARMTITKSAETAPPYGLFKIDFQMVDPVTMAEFGRGVLVAEKDPTTGEAVLKWASDDPGMNRLEFSSLAKDPNGTTGHGTVLTVERGAVATTAKRFDIAYNTNFFRRNDNADSDPLNDICLDRQKFSESAWSYGLYKESDGSRFDLNSGFSIKVGGEYGWIGYWGVWLPPGVTLTNGQTVYQHDYQTDTDTPYTVFQAGGKLKKHTRNQLKLTDIKNVPLYWWDCSGVSCVNYQVVWQDTGGGIFKFQKVAQQNPAPDYTWLKIAVAADLNLSALNSSDLYFYSQALSGQVRVPLGAAAPATCSYDSVNHVTNCSPFNVLAENVKAATPVIFYSENIVYPGEAVPSPLACFDNCPDATLATGINTTAVALPFHSTWNAVTGTSTRWEYTFSPSSMLLMDPNLPNPPDPVVLAAKSADPFYSWGVTTGALFNPAAIEPILGKTYLDLLACDWDITKTCGWKAWSELPVFYTWETGPDSWNQLTVLRNSAGNFVKFDPPLQVKYIHRANAFATPSLADLKYDGVTFYLEYNGFGSLQGIPGVCVNMNTGATESCGPNTWWVPEFLIPDVQFGGTLTEVLIDGDAAKPLVVKALQIEQRMKTAACDPALVTTPYPLPDMSAYDKPSNGTMPNITSAPKVIGGVIQ